ncbi:MAG: ABC transporter permease [candidate division Zixibacteria bacterium]|nr:ABC transporter permease [candidate division Zixibacteria bacterium]
MYRNYLKISLRNIVRNRGYTFINVAGLAVGLACCILIMLWVTDEISFDKFHKNYDNVYRVIACYNDTEQTEYEWKTAPPLASALKADFPEVTAVTRYRPMNGHLFKIPDNISHELDLGLAEPAFLDIFTFPLTAGDARTVLNEPNSIILTEKTARKLFGVQDPLGKSISVDNALDLTVTGVMADVPANSHLQFDCLAPFVLIEKFMQEYGSVLDNWGMGGFATYVLLDDAATGEDMNLKLPGYLKKYAETETELSLQPLKDIYLYSSHINHNLFGNGDIKYVYIFSLIALFVLGIACFNFMNLTTARSANRAREVGLRKVVGAARHQIIVQFFNESLLLAFIALVFAVLMVEIFLPAFNNLSGKELTITFFDNPGMLTGLILIVLFTGLLSGSYPALFMSFFKPVKVLKGSFKAGGSGAMLRKALVVTQFTISILLIISTLVISNQLDFMRHKKLGFDKEQLLYMKMASDMPAQYEAFKSELLHETGVTSVTVTSSLPTHGIVFSTSHIEWPGKTGENKWLMNAVSVGEGYIETFGMKLKEGRFLAVGTSSFSDSIREAVLNETAVEKMNLDSPVGKTIEFSGFKVTVAGVVKDYYFQSLHHSMEPLAIVSVPEWYSYIFVKINSDSMPRTVATIEQIWKKFSPDTPFSGRFLSEAYESLYRSEQRMGQLFNYFTSLAIFISCLGLFGLAAYMAEQRTREIGIRKVLGASLSGLTFMISSEFIKWVLIANAIAWPLAFVVMNRWLQSFAYRISISWTVFVVSGALAVIIALLTVSFLAFKAALSDPVKALKYE